MLRSLGQRTLPEVITEARESEALSSLERARCVRWGVRPEAQDLRGGREVRLCIPVTLEKGEVMTVNSQKATNVH